MIQAAFSAPYNIPTYPGIPRQKPTDHPGGRDNIPTIDVGARLSQPLPRISTIRGQNITRQRLECACFSTAFPPFSQAIGTAAVNRRTPGASRNSSANDPHPACCSYQHPPILIPYRPVSTAPLALLTTFKEYFQKSHFPPAWIAKTCQK
jgi:hypothetical protein